MNCERVKELLNEYVDGTIDAQLKELVEEHLSGCSNCAQELNSLKAYLETVGSLEKVDAPENFLKSVNEKLENENSKLQEQPNFETEPEIKDIKQKTFMPFGIKLPLQALGVLAIVLFVVFLVKVIQPNKEMPIVAPLLKEELVEDEILTADEKEPLALAMQKEKLAVSVVSEIKPVELVLLIKPEVKTNTLDYEGKGLSEPVDALRVGEVTAQRAVSSMDVDSAYAVSPVENLIKSLGGNVLSVKYDEAETQIISAEISKEKYSNLLKNLDNLHEFQKPSPSFIGTEGDFIKIRVKLTPSN